MAHVRIQDDHLMSFHDDVDHENDNDNKADGDLLVPLLNDENNSEKFYSDTPLPLLNGNIIKLLSFKLPYKDLYHFRLTSKQMNEFIEGTPIGQIARQVSNMHSYSLSLNISTTESRIQIANTRLDDYARQCDSDCRIAYATNCTRFCPGCGCDYCCCVFCCSKNHWIATFCSLVPSACFVGFNPFGVDSFLTYVVPPAVAVVTYGATMAAGYLLDQCLFSRRNKLFFDGQTIREIKERFEEPLDEDACDNILSTMKAR
jgi:hypothetical protein